MLVPNKIYCLIFFVDTFTGDIFNTSIIKLSYKPYSLVLFSWGTLRDMAAATNLWAPITCSCHLAAMPIILNWSIYIEEEQ